MEECVMIATDPRTVAGAYINAVSAHDLAALEDLLDDELTATFAGVSSGKADWLAALERIVPALIRNDIYEIFADDNRACVIYDFVTDTPGGTIRCVELVTVSHGKITAIELILDRIAFAPVNKALSERAE
jgi:SnoaL-like domain